jgi:hypothetical protein
LAQLIGVCRRSGHVRVSMTAAASADVARESRLKSPSQMPLHMRPSRPSQSRLVIFMSRT